MTKRHIIYLVVIFFSLLSPIFSILCIIFFLYDKTNKLYPIFLGILVYHLSFLFNPSESYDYFRHLERLRNNMSFNDIIFYYIIHGQTNFIFPFISKILTTLSFSPKVTLAIISGFMTFNLASISEKYNTKNRLISRLIICFGLSYISILSGMRFMLGLSILASSFYLKDKNKLISYILFIFSILTHISLIVTTPILFLNKNKNKIKLNIFVGIILILVSIFLKTIIIYILSKFSFFKPIEIYFDSYINEVDSFKRNYLWFVFKFAIIYIFFKKLFNFYLDKSFTYLSLILLVFISFPIILDRFILLGIILGILPNLNTFLKKEQLIILFLLFFRFTIEIYDNLEVYMSSFLRISILLNI